jgi:hypothetical protein
MPYTLFIRTGMGKNHQMDTYKIIRNPARKNYRQWRAENGQGDHSTAPEKLTIRNREQMADCLDEAMGFGAS